MALVGNTVQRVELGYGFVEALRPEYDGKCADVTLFVKHAQIRPEPTLRDLQRALHGGTLLLEHGLLLTEMLCLCVK